MHIEHEAVSITKIRSQVKRLKHVGARRDTTPPKDLKVHSEPPVTHMGYTGNTREK